MPTENNELIKRRRSQLTGGKNRKFESVLNNLRNDQFQYHVSDNIGIHRQFTRRNDSLRSRVTNREGKKRDRLSGRTTLSESRQTRLICRVR